MSIPIVEEERASGEGYSGATISRNGWLMSATSNQYNGWAEGY